MSRILTLAGGLTVALDSIDVNLPGNLIDMFSRLRVSEPTTQVVINQSTALRARLLTEGEVSGSNTSSVYNASRASTTLSVGATTGLRRLKSIIAGLYQPGKSLLFFFTFNLGNSAADVTKRVGYFDDSDGVFLEQTTTGLSWVIRSSAFEGVTESDRVLQSSWNADKFDGTQQGYDFDVTKCHIGFIAVEWLGVGDVAVGFIYNQVPVIAHVFKHPNNKDRVYMRTANLFPCYEIERTAPGVGTTSLEAICSSLLTEGANDSLGVTYSVSRGISSTFNAGNSSTFYALMLFRLNPNNVTARVKLQGADVIVVDTCVYSVYIVRNPTFNAAYTPTWQNRLNSSVQYDNTVPNSVVVTNALDNETSSASGSPNKQAAQNTNVNADLDFLGTDFNYEPEVWAIVIQCNSNNITVESVIAKFWEQV